MPEIERDGLKLSFHDSGTGPPLILHHGLAADGRSFQANGMRPALLAAGFRCVIVDAAGHGRSGPAQAADRVDLAARVADVLAVADALDLDRFGYFGYSMGAWIGTGLLDRHAHRLGRVALSGWDPVNGARDFTPLTDEGERATAFRAMLSSADWATVPLPPERLDGYVATYRQLFGRLPDVSVLAKAPVMLSIGADDPYAASVCETARSLGCPLTILPGDHVSAFFANELVGATVDWFVAKSNEAKCPNNLDD